MATNILVTSEHPVSDVTCSEGTIRFSVKNIAVSKVNRSVFTSPAVDIGNFKWKMVVMPKGTLSCIKDLGINIKCNPTSQSLSWSCPTYLSLYLLNQGNGNDIIKNVYCDYKQGYYEAGAPRFASWSDISDPQKGFIKDGCFKFEAWIVVNGPNSCTDLTYYAKLHKKAVANGRTVLVTVGKGDSMQLSKVYKSVLAKESKVLAGLLKTSGACVNFPDEKPSTLYHVLLVLHGLATLKKELIDEIMPVIYKYQLAGLLKTTVLPNSSVYNTVRNLFPSCNIEEIADCALKVGCKETLKYCMIAIAYHAQYLFSKSDMSFSFELLREVLKNKYLSITSEATVVTAVRKWLLKHSKDSGTNGPIGNILGDDIYNVRFGALSLKEVTTYRNELCDLIPEEDVNALVQYKRKEDCLRLCGLEMTFEEEMRPEIRLGLGRSSISRRTPYMDCRQVPRPSSHVYIKTTSWVGLFGVTLAESIADEETNEYNLIVGSVKNSVFTGNDCYFARFDVVTGTDLFLQKIILLCPNEDYILSTGIAERNNAYQLGKCTYNSRTVIKLAGVEDASRTLPAISEVCFVLFHDDDLPRDNKNKIIPPWVEI